MREMQDMTEPELKFYFNSIMTLLKDLMPPDVEGYLLMVFQKNGITQYASSIEREGAIASLRELADGLEKKGVVDRN